MTAPRLLLATLATLATAVAVATGIAVVEAREPQPRVVAAPPRTDALQVLAAWDRRRAAAWAGGDAVALAGLYAPGSAAGRADVAMLERWVDRGLRVTGLRMQVLGVDVRRAAADRLDLVVTDRLAGGVAVGGATEVPLPRDGWSTRRVVLERAAAGWVVADVSPAPS